jgi:hypothetical protein
VKTIQKTESTKKEKTPAKSFKIFGVEFVYLYLLGIIFALIGWVAENTAKIVISGSFDSRFHILPFIGIYAIIPFSFHIVFGNPDSIAVFGKKLFKIESKKTVILSNLITYFSICAAVFLGELAVGNAWDFFFGVKLWNYNNLPLHLTQYTSIVSTFGFGTGAYLLFKFMCIPLLKVFKKKIPIKVAFWIVATLGSLIFLDMMRMIASTIILGEAPNFWKVKLF